MLFPSLAVCEHVTGTLHIIEGGLDCSWEIGKFLCHVRRLTRFAHEEVSHDFRASLHSEEAAKLEQETRDEIWVRGLAEVTEADPSASVAVLRKQSIFLSEHGDCWKE
jgi:hypothetical protein